MAYPDHVTSFDSDPMGHVKTIRTLFDRKRNHNHTFLTSNVHLGPTAAESFGPLRFAHRCASQNRKTTIH